MVVRAKQSDWLSVDAARLTAGTYTYLRVAQYKQSHMLSKHSPDNAKCGNGMIIDSDWWDNEFRPNMEKNFGKDPGEWYIALEVRKGDRCKQCANGDVWEKTDFEFKKAAPYEPPTELPVSTPAERLEVQRNNAAVSRVARELDATIL